MKILVILHNIRSTYNVGAILRSCDGFGVDEVVYSGYTPVYDDPELLPHLRDKLNKQIEKVALGAEKSVKQRSAGDISEFLDALRSEGYTVVGLENNLEDERLVELRELPERLTEVIPGVKVKKHKLGPISMTVAKGKADELRVALLLGEEVDGIPSELYDAVDIFAEIPMQGEKESFNVSVAAGGWLYELRRNRGDD